MTSEQERAFTYNWFATTLHYASQVWSPQTIQLIKNIEKVKRRATKYILNLGFTTNVHNVHNKTTSTWLTSIILLAWIFRFSSTLQKINGYTYIDDIARPTMTGSGITRSQTNKDIIKFSVPFANTVTFQTSYFIRSCKTWNILGCDLRHKDIGLYTFKSKLKTYYEHALSNVYDCDDPRTWKSIYVKCRRAKSRDGGLSCC